MKQILVIAEREIRERKLVFLAAAIMAAISALAPLMPGTHSYQRGDILIISGAAWAVAFTAALAIAFGGGIVGGDLRSGHMSFYFSKPVGAGAMWFGKVLGALTTIAVAAVIILIPAILLGGKAWEMRIDKPLRLVMITAGSALLLFLVSHVVSTLIASRSPLVLIDLAIALALTIAMYFIVRPLALARATYSTTAIVVFVLVAVVAAILGSGARQLARGRTDARRNHVELSKVLWVCVFVAVIAAAGFGKWARTLTPQTHNLWGFMLAPGGDWLVLEGVRDYTDYHGSLLMNTRTGKTQQVPARDVIFSRNGKMSAWMQPSGKNSNRVMTMRLDGRGVEQDTGIRFPGAVRMTLSDDGKRVAVLIGDMLLVQEVETKRLLGSVSVDRFGGRLERVRMFFESAERLRLYTVEKRDSQQLLVGSWRFSPTARSLEALGRYETDATTVTFTVDSSGSRMLLREEWGDERERQQLVDPYTFKVLVASLPGGASPFRTASFLSDGSIAIVDKVSEARVLRIVSQSGQVLKEFRLVDNGSATIGREIDQNRLLLAIAQGPWEKRQYSVVILNLVSGQVEHREMNARPILPNYGFETELRPLPASTSVPALLVEDSGTMRKLWRWNPSTGSKTPLIN